MTPSATSTVGIRGVPLHLMMIETAQAIVRKFGHLVSMSIPTLGSPEISCMEAVVTMFPGQRILEAVVLCTGAEKFRVGIVAEANGRRWSEVVTGDHCTTDRVMRNVCGTAPEAMLGVTMVSPHVETGPPNLTASPPPETNTMTHQHQTTSTATASSPSETTVMTQPQQTSPKSEERAKIIAIL